MEILPCLLVTLLAMYVMPSALALKCYECSNDPEETASQCNAKEVGSRTCGMLSDKCMSLKGTMNVPLAGPLEIEMKNCSYSFSCDPTSSLNMCNMLNFTGDMIECDVKCCGEDLCNGATRVSDWIASFTAILLAVGLTLY